MIWLILTAIALAAATYRIGHSVGFARGLRAAWSDHYRGDDE